MALPRGMFRRGQVLWARKDVPKPLQSIIGVTSLQESLRTGDLNLARVVFHEVMSRFEARIANARTILANGPKQIETISLSAEQLGMTRAQIGSYVDWLQARPEVQNRLAIERIEGKLIEGDLIEQQTSLHQIYERWKRERTPKVNAVEECKRAIDEFIRLNGDKPIAEYTSTDARRYKDAVVDMKFKGRPLAHGSKLKWFGAIRTLFRLADSNDLLSVNPFEKISLERSASTKKARREEWTLEEFQALFDCLVYTQHQRPRTGAGEAAYWAPVLALYHGFRVAEICQLDRADVIERAGIW